MKKIIVILVLLCVHFSLYSQLFIPEILHYYNGIFFHNKPSVLVQTLQKGDYTIISIVEK